MKTLLKPPLPRENGPDAGTALCDGVEGATNVWRASFGREIGRTGSAFWADGRKVDDRLQGVSGMFLLELKEP